MLLYTVCTSRVCEAASYAIALSYSRYLIPPAKVLQQGNEQMLMLGLPRKVDEPTQERRRY